MQAVLAGGPPPGAREALPAPAGREPDGQHGGGHDDDGGDRQPQRRPDAREQIADRPEEAQDRVDDQLPDPAEEAGERPRPMVGMKPAVGQDLLCHLPGGIGIDGPEQRRAHERSGDSPAAGISAGGSEGGSGGDASGGGGGPQPPVGSLGSSQGSGGAGGAVVARLVGSSLEPSRWRRVATRRPGRASRRWEPASRPSRPSRSGFPMRPGFPTPAGFPRRPDLPRRRAGARSRGRGAPPRGCRPPGREAPGRTPPCGPGGRSRRARARRP